MKVKCLIHSTAGKKGEIKEFPDNRARQLIEKKICEEVKKVEEKKEVKKESKKKDKK
jgi:hypothetical protein